jgi:iron-sulfur cluster repair protein YtfE (RIC family)
MPESSELLTIDTTVTVNDVLVQHPEAVSVFNEFGIDACCGGDASLEEAAQRDGTNVQALIAALNALIAREDR